MYDYRTVIAAPECIEGLLCQHGREGWRVVAVLMQASGHIFALLERPHDRKSKREA